MELKVLGMILMIIGGGAIGFLSARISGGLFIVLAFLVYVVGRSISQ